MQTGKVKWFNSTKGYGFIESSENNTNPKARDVFLHMSALEKAGLRSVNEGQKVSFELENKGDKISAINIKLI